MSTLKTHNLQSSDSGSVNIALTPNAGMIVTGLTTFTGSIDVDGHTDLDNVSIAGVTTISSTLNVSGNTNLSSELRANANIRMTNAGPKITFVDSDNNPDYEVGNADGVFRIRDATSGVNRLTISTGGLIGVNNSSPQSQYFNNLVVGNNDSGDKGITIRCSSSNSGILAFSDTDSATSARYAGYISYNHSTNGMVFHTLAGDARMTIDSSGRLLLGQTSAYSTNQMMIINGASHAGNSYNGQLMIQGSETNGNSTTGGRINFAGHDGNTARSWANITGAKENGTTGNTSAYLSFDTRPNSGNPTERLRITSYGDVYATNSAYNTYDTAATSVNTVVEANENRSGVYWLDFNSVKFRAYVKANWLQGRNWVLAAKYFDPQDMPSGSSLWTNDTYVNESDFNLYGGLMSKYRSWRYFSFNRLAMQMGNRIPPIMQFNSNQTLYGAFSGGYASNGGGVTANSTDPAMSGTSVTYHGMDNYAGPDFHDVGGSEDRLGSYGLNKWANSAANSTSGNNQGSENYYPQHRIEAGGSQSDNHSIDSESVKGFRMTIEDSHPNLTGVDSLGRAGAWIGCPLDEGSSQQGSAGSNVGADSGFGMGGCSGNNARTWTSGYAEWNLGNSVVNCLPAYIWLSID